MVRQSHEATWQMAPVPCPGLAPCPQGCGKSHSRRRGTATSAHSTFLLGQEAGTDLVSPIRHRKGEGIRVLFPVTGVDVPDAARGQVCLAEGTNSCPWKTNNRGKCATERAKQGKTAGNRTYLATRTQFWLVLIRAKLPMKLS